jgi:hypothetical protein
MLIKLKSKRAISIAIVVLVMMALMLVSAAVVVFYLDQSKTSTKISDSRILNEVYAKGEKIDFYINDIMTRASLKINNRENPKPEFITYFKEELLKYKQKNSYIISELEGVEGQINEQNIEVADVEGVDGIKEISINLNFKIDKTFENKFMVSYIYNKKYKVLF